MTLDRQTQSLEAEALLAHAGWVRKLAKALARGHEFADDTEQEAWRIALERPPAHDSNLKAWWGRVVASAAAQRQRTEGRQRRHVQVLSECAQPEPQDDPALLAERLESFEQLTRLVRQLPEPYGSTVIMHFFDQTSLGAMAKRLGIPKATVQGRVRRGLAMLRTRLRQSHGDDWRTRCLALALPSSPLSLTGATLTALLMKAQSKALLLVAMAAGAGSLAIWQPWATGDDHDPTEAQLVEAATAVAQDKAGSAEDPPGERVLVPAPPPPAVTDQEDPRFLLPAGKKRDAWIEIEILDAQGNPWPDLPLDCTAHPSYAIPARYFQTNDQGMVRLPCISGEWTLMVTSYRREGGNGVGLDKRLEVIPGETQRFSVRYPRRADIRGVLLDPGGIPISGSRIRYSGESQDQDVRRRETAVTELDGSFQFDGFEGRISISAFPEGLPVMRLRSQYLPAEDAGSLVLQYPPCRLVTLRVVDRSQNPVGEMEVNFFQYGGTGEVNQKDGIVLEFIHHKVGITDQNGLVLVPAQAAAPWNLKLSHPLYGTLPLTLPAGIEEFTFQIPSGVSIHGRVLDADGNPLAGARILGWAADNSPEALSDPRKQRERRPDNSREWKETISNQEGTFLLEQLSDSNEGYLLVEADGMAYASLQDVPFPCGPDGIMIQMEKAHPIAGRLLDLEDIPVSGRTVEIRGHSVFGREEEWVNLPYFFDTFRSRTDGDGNFSFPNLEAGNWEVKVFRITGFNPAAVLQVAAGTQDLVVHLGDGLSERINIRGTVVDAITQQPIPDFEAYLAFLEYRDGREIGGGADQALPVNGKNQFHYSGKEIQPYAVQVNAPGYVPFFEAIPVRAGDYEFQVQLSPAVRVDLQFQDSSGSPLAGLPVAAFSADNQPLITDQTKISLALIELGRSYYPGPSSTSENGHLLMDGLPRQRNGYFRVGGEDGKPSLDVSFLLEAGDGDEVMVVTLPDDFVKEWRGGSAGG